MKCKGMRGVPVVYLDVLVAINWFVDCLLLSAMALIMRRTAKRWRIVLGGLIGALCAALLFISNVPPALQIVFHYISACILVRISFPYVGLFYFIKETVVLYTVSALFSGVMTALWAVTNSEFFCANNGVLYMDLSPLSLTILAVLSYGTIRLYEYFTRRKAPVSHEFWLQIDDKHGICECRALYDTGMQVTEPFSGKPVVIVERSALEPFLSQDLCEALCCTMKIANTDCNIPYRRLRMIPYRSLGTEGILPAFVPHSMKILSLTGDARDISGTYVALTGKLGQGDYQALVGSESVEGIK